MTGLGTRARELVTRTRGALSLKDRDRRGRGAAELSLVVVAGSLVAGVFFGNGLSHTSVHLADGLTWLSDSPSGEVVQVDPASGRLENRQLVAKPGDHLDVAQYGGHLYVTNQSTGQLMSFDLTSILVSGQRRVASGGVVDTLSHGSNVFLVDKSQNTISDIDPVTTDAVGTIWVAPAALADVAIDGRGTVWALQQNGDLHELTWSTDTQAFVERADHTIANSGPNSVLVAHDQGVTVFGPDQGIVQQVGTGHDVHGDADKVMGTLMAPKTAPSDLVPVATSDGDVVIVTPKQVVDVSMATMGCDTPGTPQVFHDTVYVPCSSSGSGDDGSDGGKVVRLSPTGQRVGDDISTPDSSQPQLVLSDTNLIINTPGAAHGVVVHGDGTVSGVTRSDPSVPVSTPAPVDTTSPSDSGVLNSLFGHDPSHDQGDHPDHDDKGDKGDQGDQHHGPIGTVACTLVNCPTNPPTTGSPTDSPTGTPTDGSSGDPSHDPTNGHGHHGDGPSDGDTGDPHADPINAPTNVSAVALPEGQVQISWQDDSDPAPEGFVIRSTEGDTFATLKGDIRQAVISVTPGQATAFTVTAVLGKQEATSRPTEPVTTTARPGDPDVNGTAVYQPNGHTQQFVVTITWSSAAANGAPVNEYDVSVSIPGSTKTSSTDGSARSATFTWTCDMSQDPSCQVGGDVKATVTAVNALGSGNAGAVAVTAPPQPPPPPPANGEQVVAKSSPSKTSADQSGEGDIKLTLKPPSDWAKFPGTCAYTIDGGGGGQLACSAGSVDVPFHNGYIRDPSSGTVQHKVTFTASNDSGTATSASYSFTSTQPTLCESCDIP